MIGHLLPLDEEVHHVGVQQLGGVGCTLRRSVVDLDQPARAAFEPADEFRFQTGELLVGKLW